MKISSALKLLKVGCILGVAMSGTLRTEGQAAPVPAIQIFNPITNVDFPQIGTLDKLTVFAVHTVNQMTTFAWYYNTNGRLVYYGGVVWYGSLGSSPYIYGPFTNKNALDQKYALNQECISNVTTILTSFMTSTNQSIDKSKGFNIYLHCTAYSGAPSLDTFYWYSPHVYLVETNGGYALPDLSYISAWLNSAIPIYLPGLQWARYDIGHAGDTNSFEVDDTNLDASTDPINIYGFLDLPTGYMTNSSSANGQFWIKTTAYTTNSTGGKLWIWNGDGNPVPELGVKKGGTNAAIMINGGVEAQLFPPALERSCALDGFHQLHREPRTRKFAAIFVAVLTGDKHVLSHENDQRSTVIVTFHWLETPSLLISLAL